MGNSLLDIMATVEPSYLEKYDLKSNDAILAEEKHAPIYAEIVRDYKVEYVAGGATQNSIKVAQWMTQTPNATTFFGCIGDDTYGNILEEKAKEVGVSARYMRTNEKQTGLCAALICGKDRSLIADLSAANLYKIDHLEKNFECVEAAQFYYVAGFFLTVSTDSMIKVGKHAVQNDKTFTINLSAPFLCQFFLKQMTEVMPYADVVFGNETEAAAFSEAMKFGTTDLKEIAMKIAALPKENSSKPRMVVITQGDKPTFVAYGAEKVKEFAIIPLKPEDIIDTNGAGDAFVGGFLSQLVSNKPLQKCIDGGNYAANVIIQRAGCTFPSKCDF